MKKILALLLAVWMIAALAACADGDSNESGTKSAAATEPATEAPPRSVADDTAVMALSFTPPAAYRSVYRTVSQNAEGKLTEKDMIYEIDDDTQLGFVAIADERIENNISVADLETMQAAGADFYLMKDDTSVRAFVQRGADIYGVLYAHAQGATTELFDSVMQGLRFIDTTETELNENPEALGTIRWSFDPSWRVITDASLLKENADKKVTEKACEWQIGADPTDAEKISYRFRISVYPDQALADVLGADKADKEVTVNGLTYSVGYDGDKAYRYYIQQDDGVYLLENVGSYNGLWYTRTDASYEAFDLLLNSISFATSE